MGDEEGALVAPTRNRVSYNDCVIILANVVVSL